MTLASVKLIEIKRKKRKESQYFYAKASMISDELKKKKKLDSFILFWCWQDALAGKGAAANVTS
jgi:hypothetical protein